MSAPAVPPPVDRPRNRIQVSREKRPLNFFVGLAKKFLANEDEVELSGLGLAVTTVVTVVEILRAAGQAEIARVETSLVDAAPDGRAAAPKAKIQIWVRKGPNFGVSAAAARDAATPRKAAAPRGTAAAAAEAGTVETNGPTGSAPANGDAGDGVESPPEHEAKAE